MTKTTNVFLILVILCALVLSPAHTQQAPGWSKLQPVLQQIAVQKPDQQVSVIVQATGNNAEIQNAVTGLGGKITRDLHIINAFSAEMSAESALQLAADPAVRWISLDAPVEGSGKPTPIDWDALPQNTYLDTISAPQAWDMGLKGQGVTVAVIDSGIAYDPDFRVNPKKAKSRILVQQRFNNTAKNPSDVSGHGTFVAGIIGGNGADSKGQYTGVAPMVNLVGLKISNEQGMAYESDAVEAMQWVQEHQKLYNIRVVNLSLNTTQEASYHNSPMDAAAEILWFNGIVVVASSGNKSHGTYNTANAAPANDPFIITVGAVDEHGTGNPADDTLAFFSAHGKTQDGYMKPELVAPGKNIVSVLATSSPWDQQHPDHVVVPDQYLYLSGTSMSAPMVSGAVALLLQSEPELTPDQVKYRLMATANEGPGNEKALNIYAALTTPTEERANQGVVINQMLWQGDEPVVWDSIAWNSIAWNSIAWNSIAWNSLAWNSLAWNSLAWNSLAWNSTVWDK